jgi:methionyl-tRNA formyltransferase
MHLGSSAVAQAAERLGAPLYKPPTLRSPEAVARLREASPDLMVVAAYGLILPQEVLDVPRQGCLNIHASLLPRWRGAAPVQRAILAGDSETGISLMEMDAGLDTGPVVWVERQPIRQDDTAGTLTEALGRLGARCLVEAIPRLGTLPRRVQDDSAATYAAKLTKAGARLDWARPAAELDRMVRAFDPYPGAETRLAASPLKIWSAKPVPGSGAPGTVLALDGGAMVVACGQHALAVREVQRPGGKRMAITEFLRGAKLARGDVLESAISA